MHIVALAWIFVVLLMTLAEATSTQGSLLGALITLLLYGALPLGIVLYVLGTPARARARRAAAAAAQQASAPLPDAAAPGSAEPGDGSGHAPGVGLAPERKEP